MQIRSGAPKAVGFTTCYPPGSSCSQSGSKCSALCSLGPRRFGREGDPVVWASQGLHTHLPRLAPWRGHSSFAVLVRVQHGRQQLRVISPCLIGVELDATGCLRRWEGSSYPTGQLSPASSWAAPVQ